MLAGRFDFLDQIGIVGVVINNDGIRECEDEFRCEIHVAGNVCIGCVFHFADVVKHSDDGYSVRHFSCLVRISIEVLDGSFFFNIVIFSFLEKQKKETFWYRYY